MKSQLLSGAIWIGLSRFAVNGIGLISTVVLARLLMPDDFGLVATASAAALVIAALSEMSLTQALVQHEDPGIGHFDTVFTLNLIRGVIIALAVGVISWPFAQAYGDDRLIGLMLCFALSNFLSCLANPKLAVFERRLEFRQWIVLSGGEKLAGFVFAALIAYYLRSYWALAVGAVASQVMRTAASYFLIGYTPRISLVRWRELLSFSAWLMFAQVVQAISYRADPLVYAVFMPARTVGYFSMGSRISSLAVNEVLQPISQVLFPAFSHIKSEPSRLAHAYLRAQDIMSLIALPVGFGIAAIADQLVRVVLGERWLAAVPVIQFLAVASVFQRTNQLNPLAMATGDTRVLFYRELRGLVIRLPLVLGGIVLGPRLGATELLGAVTGHALSSFINGLLNMHMVSRISPVTMREQLTTLWRPGLAAMMMSAAIWFVSGLDFAGTSFKGQVLLLLASVAVGAVAYAAAVLCLWHISGRPHSSEAEVLALLRERIVAVRARLGMR